QNTNMSQISNPNKMSYYLACTLTYKKQDQFEKHILNITIENEAANGMHKIIKTKAQEDSNTKQEILGSILVTSRGELLIWEAKDISEKIQIIGLVTDSTSSYAVA
ncbi:16943_t:CDS:2, partial [Gigaspora margarita]